MKFYFKIKNNRKSMLKETILMHYLNKFTETLMIIQEKLWSNLSRLLTVLFCKKIFLKIIN